MQQFEGESRLRREIDWQTLESCNRDNDSIWQEIVISIQHK